MVSLNRWSNAQRNRKYPDLNVGYEVRVVVNNDSKTKDYIPTWPSYTYPVICSTDHDYSVNEEKLETYVRHERLRVCCSSGSPYQWQSQRLQLLQ